MSIRILHLEDNIADAELIRIELEREYNEYEIKHVSNRNDYVEALQNEQFNIILSEYNIPDIMGLESLELANTYGSKVPFIYVSGAIGEEGAAEMRKLGATDYVLKSKLEKLHISIFRSVQAYRYHEFVEEKEQQIKDQQLEYRYLIERMNEGFIKVNTDNKIAIVNPAVCSLFEAKPADLIGKDINYLLDIPNDKSEFQLIDISSSLEYDKVLTRSNNDRFWAHIRISKQLNELGDCTGFAIIINDITDQKLSEVWEDIISKIARKLSTSESSINTFFQKLHLELQKHIPFDNYFAILKENVGQIRLVYHKADREESQTPQYRRNALGLSEHILQTKEAVWLKGEEIGKFENENGISVQGERHKCLICVPIVAEDKCVGVMGCLDSNSKDTFNEFHFKVLMYVGSHIGIFIRKLESEINRNSILQLSEDLICTLNKSGELIYANPAFQNILGYDESELLYQPLVNIFVRDEIASHKNLHKTLKSGNGTQKIDSSIVTKYGDIRAISWTIMGVEKCQSFYCIGRDFTEKQAIQKRIEESEKRYRGLFQRMNEGLMSCDPNGVILNVNPSLCKMLGYTNDELVGKIGYEFLHEPDTADRLKQKVKYRKAGKPALYETIFLHKNGSKVWTNISANPDYDDDGNFSGVMLIVLNITDCKQAEKAAYEIKEAFTKELESKVTERTMELEDARKELALSLEKEKELGRLKSRFVSTASHQFRTPLSVIQSNLGLLSMHMDTSECFHLDKELQPKFNKISERIKSQITRMTDLMNDVLILGKINEGNITLRLIRQPLVPICQEVLDNHSHVNQKKSNPVRVTGEPTEILFDEQLFSHALSNLVSNAFKYSNNGALPTVSVHFEDDSVEIKVSDKGIGIPERELQHLFEPFYRASNVNEYSGTGLGTAIAKEYIELIGGSISVKSELGKGTEFIINLNTQNHGENTDS